jgi:hypothetical protein
MTRHIPPRKKNEPDPKYLPSNADKDIESHSDRISFSFHYLNLNHNKFNLSVYTCRWTGVAWHAGGA